MFQKMPKNTIKLGKQQKKLGTSFLTYILDQFLSYRRPNLGPALTLQHIYTHIYIYILYVCVYIYIYACCRVNNLATFWPLQGQ